MSATGLVKRLVNITPPCVIRGFQVALGVLLGKLSLELVGQGPFAMVWNWVLGVVALLVILILKDNRYAPAALVLVVGGTLIPLFRGQLGHVHFGVTLPPLILPDWRQMWRGWCWPDSPKCR